MNGTVNVPGVSRRELGEVRKIAEAAVVTLTHEKVDTVHTFTGLGEKTGLVAAQFKANGSFTAGDTATIDGIGYTITTTGADEPEDDLFVSGKAVMVTVDTEALTVNFKAGGGLSGGMLASVTATPDKVFVGETFIGAGSKEVQTGTYDPDWAIKRYW